MTIYFFHKNELKLTFSDFGSQQKEKEEEEYVKYFFCQKKNNTKYVG